MLLGDVRLCRFSDAPLAPLIGTPAKRVKEKGAPSLKHPFSRVFIALRRFAAGDYKGAQYGVFPMTIDGIFRVALSSPSGVQLSPTNFDHTALHGVRTVIDWSC
jgi:hypothetical protein